MLKKKIYIVVGGRFHSDKMAKVFLNYGCDIKLFTSFTKKSFSDISKDVVISLPISEIIFRLFKKLNFENFGDTTKMELFGKHVARLLKPNPDIIIGWSSFSLESFRLKISRNVLVRDSAHILTQNDILKNEYVKLGFKYPDRTICINRELEEYELAEEIFVLSEFAKKSFLEHGVNERKLKIVRLGVDASVFKPNRSIRTKLPLKVVYFGSISIQKGVHYLLSALENFSTKTIELHLVGAIEHKFKKILKNYNNFIYHKPMNHFELNEFLHNMDVFVFPSLHDGFGQTLIQAMSVGLFPIVTETVGAGELISDGVDGIKIPPSNSNRIREIIYRLSENLDFVDKIRNAAIETAKRFSWEKYENELIDWLSRR